MVFCFEKITHNYRGSLQILLLMSLSTITAFLEEIGLPVFWETIQEPTFLPGIYLRNGTVVIDKEKLLYPGDVLHEAGHLAVMPPRIRATMTGDLGMDPIHHGGELMAIPWSYAACLHLGMDPHIVFHEQGYKSGGKEIVQNFREGRYFGVPLLAWQEMTDEKAFPQMKSWLCTTDKYEEPANNNQ